MDAIKNLWTSATQFRYFNELAFVVAVLLILWAWKFGIEGIRD